MSLLSDDYVLLHRYTSTFLTEIRGTSGYCSIVADDMARHIDQVVTESLPECQLPTTTATTTASQPPAGGTTSKPDGNGEGGEGNGGQGGDDGKIY